MDNVLDIFYEYSINNKLLDRKAISKILDIILKNNKFDDKILYIITKDSKFDITSMGNCNILGEFDMDSIIYIYYWEMLKSIRKKKYLTNIDRKYELNNIEIMFKKNMLILQTLFHEVEHVKQLESVKNIYNNSIEGKLYQYEINYIYPHYDIFDKGIISYYSSLIKHEIIYNNNYNISFMERMANIKSLEEIYKLLLRLGNDYSKLYDIQREIIDDYMIKDYSNGLIGPTTRFISNLGYNRYFTKDDLLSITEKLDFDDRIIYGFQISEEEYKKRIKI